MSYHRTRNSNVPLGGVTDVFNAVAAVVQDPCLSPVTTLVLRLHAAAQGAPAPRPAPSAPSSAVAASVAPPPTAIPTPSAPPAKGIGLCYAVKPLKAVAWAAEHRWAVPVGAAAVVGGLVGLGYILGKRSR